jgi:hypothetical protein
MHDPIKELAARIEKRVAHLKRLRQTGHGLIARARKAVRKANTIRARSFRARARIVFALWTAFRARAISPWPVCRSRFR